MLRAPLLLTLAALLAPSPLLAGEQGVDPNHVAAVIGPHGGLVQLPNGTQAGMLAGSARSGAGWNVLDLRLDDPQSPLPEGVGPRAIDRRASTPTGQVEGDAVPIGRAFRLEMHPAEAIGDSGTGMIPPAQWPRWLESVPERVMPWVDPAHEAQRRGFLVAIPDAGPPGSKEEVSVWLRSPGGLRRPASEDGAPLRGRLDDDGLQRWDPCLMLGRLAPDGTAWFYLPDLGCGLDPVATWTPLREQSQGEFSAFVLANTPRDLLKDVRRELKVMAKEEAKAEKE